MALRIMLRRVALLVVLSGVFGCQGRHSFDWRSNNALFRPLDLPTPNAMRTVRGMPGAAYWQQQADYVIEATLDVENHAVSGHSIITYHNNSPDALDAIWLHLEQNIFKPDSRANRIHARTGLDDDQLSDGFVIDRIEANGEALELLVYDTVGRLLLADALEPGAVLQFEIDWGFRIPPETGRRMGIEEAEEGWIYELAQWFPAVAVYDDTHGWNTMDYLGSGEFYTNFGNYDVKLTVPRTHLVGATGVLQNPELVYTTEQLERLDEAASSEDTVIIRSLEEVGEEDSRPAGEGPLTWHYKAEDVRTFAWASSAAYIYDACSIDEVLVQSLYPQEKQELWSMSTQMLRTAIKGYNERLYRYPYPRATNVYGHEGGMEYPMIIFCRGRSEKGLYGVTTHEIGHNWFPMMVNTDERRHAWMDEGFNTFINYYSYGDWFEGEFGRRGKASSFARRTRNRDLPPIETAPDYLPRRTGGVLSYEKTAVGLILLREQILGEDRFDRAFKEYIRRWAFKSPRPADFFRTMEDVSGADLAWFWRGWFLESRTMDQAIMNVSHKRQDDGTYLHRARIANHGDLAMPVILDITYDDGTTEQRRLPAEIWAAKDRHVDQWRSSRRAVRVVIDADLKFPDKAPGNNRWHSGIWPSF